MSTRQQARRGGAPEGALLLSAVVGVLVLAALAYGCWVLGDTVAGVEQSVPLNPITAFLALGRGELVWPTAATVLGAVLVVLLAAAAVAVLVLRPQRRAADHPARVMARPADLTEVTGRSAREKADRLLPARAAGVAQVEPGLLVGRTVTGGAPLYVSWEYVGTVLAGPRMGKTHAVAIPAICSAPGPVVATSNKADLHHHTRLVREQVARRADPDQGRVWVSDLQGIAGEPGQDWWWNPLAGVTTLAPARVLAGYFVDAAATPGSVGSAYFDDGARELLALHLLAAACVGGDLLHVLGWLSNDTTSVPERHLDAFGHDVPAMALRRMRALNPRQRDGLFDMARQYLANLSEPAYARSITPPRRQPLDADLELGAEVTVHKLPKLDPVAFAASSDTLYALSKEGRDSASALTTALVGRIFDAAQARARRSPAGRLPVPLVAVLDEAANICKLTELPDQYSHFGSQGIVVLTVLQSPAQARKVWSEDQFAALLSASNVHYYGGGITDDRYLESLSHQVGDHDVSRWSSSTGRGDRSRSQSWSREAILPVEALAAMPKDRALVMTSGNPPVLIRKTFWQDGPHAAAIASSLRTYDPANRNPLLEQGGVR
ncbi:hypothetical protein GCM10027047_14510 [Rhodococcus aerolatus]